MFITILPTLTVATPTPPLHSSACPARWSGLPLRGGDVYDGPPEQRFILKPYNIENDGTSTWPGLHYVYARGRTVWLGCSYADDAQVFVEIDHPVRMCRYTERHKVVRLSCRRSAR